MTGRVLPIVVDISPDYDGGSFDMASTVVTVMILSIASQRNEIYCVLLVCIKVNPLQPTCPPLLSGFVLITDT